MNELFKRFRPLFVYTLIFSVCINMLMLMLPVYSMLVFDKVLSSRSLDTLYFLTILAVSAFLVIMALEILRSRLLVAVGVALETRIGPPLMDALLANALNFNAEEYNSGLRDLIVVRNFLTGTGIFALFEAMWLPVYIGIIFYISAKVGIFALICSLVQMSMGMLTEKLTRHPMEALARQSQMGHRFFETSMRNAEVVAALGMQGAIKKRWTDLNKTTLQKLMTMSHSVGMTSSVTRFVRMIVQISMLGMGAFLVLDMNMSSGVILAATFIMGRALAPIEMLISSWGPLTEARQAYQRLKNLLDKMAPPVTITDLPPPQGQLSVEQLVFGFPGNRPTLKGVSFAVNPGTSLGIIGPSASGKSTLARCLTGIWKPMAGSVRLDGADMCRWPRDKLGPYLGYLPQDVELFGGTVAYNIARLGEHDSAAIIEAAQRAQVHELILRLPMGYETPVEMLSGGQKQRIALARALFGQPRIVILDEPNSNLDGEGEMALMESLRRLKLQGVTVIMITHRPTLLHSFDKILVMRDGLIETMSSPAEVIAKYSQSAAQTAIAVNKT